MIAAWLLPGEEPTLVDCGPSTCVQALDAGLAALGLELEDVRHLVLTHIHLDHAGAAGGLVRRHPGLRVHVSEIGAPHLADPARLEASARRLYGDDFDRLWGELVPVPEENIELAGERVAGMDAWPTPGHASHHVTYLTADGSCFSGDVAGVRIPPSAYVAPVAPPPDIDVEAWERSIASIEERRPAGLFLPHFGPFEDVDEHLAALRVALAAWSERARSGMSAEEFAQAAREELVGDADAETAATYVQAGPLWQSHAGLARYWRKRGDDNGGPVD